MKSRTTKKTATKTNTKTTNTKTTTRAPLAPVTGPVAPPAMAVTFAQSSPAGLDGSPAMPLRSIEQLRAERVALSLESPGFGLTGLSLGGLLNVSLSVGDACAPEALPIELLGVVESELETLESAVRGMVADPAFEPDPNPVCRSIARLRDRINAALELHERARTATTEGLIRLRVAPPARDVAAALLMLPGVLSAPTTWERLLRIADRLDVLVMTEGPLVETHATAHLGSCYSVWPREQGGPSLPFIAIAKDAVDRQGTLARLLAFAVAKREDYGHVEDDWREAFAAVLLDRTEQKGAA